MSRLRLALLWFAAFPAVLAASPAGADLRYVLILSRHGVRSPLVQDDLAARYATDPWPRWEVKSGWLTPHGREEMRLMGAYYRARYVKEGLLSGDPSKDAPSLYFRSDADQRTIASAQALGEGLLPGQPVRVFTLTEGRSDDPLFHAAGAHVGPADPELAAAARRGREGGDPWRPYRGYRPTFELLEQVLAGPGLPVGKVSVLDDSGPADPARDGIRLVDSFVLAYADGKPSAEVGWGRLDYAGLQRLLPLQSLSFNLGARTFYVAQAEGSNLASHILATLEQAASGRPVEGALGAPGQRMAVLAGHDTNIANLGGLLNVDWWMPEGPADPTFPGGALVFELRGSAEDGFRVRLSYVSQTLDEIRRGVAPTAEAPPPSAPIFIPGCGTASPGFDAPLPAFEARLRSVIDPRFTAPEPSF